VADLVANLDETLFASVLANDSHVVHNVLPEHNDYSYSFRSRRHDRAIPITRDKRNFLTDICLKIYINFRLCNY